MAKKPAKPSLSDDDNGDDDRPRCKNMKPAKAGMSTGLLLVIIGGVGFVLLLCLAGGGAGVWWMTSKGGKGGGGGGLLGGGSKDETIILQAGQEASVRMTCDNDKRMVVTVKSKLESPQAKIESWIPVKDTNMKWSNLASGSGPNIRMEFPSPGFG
jgi:hypothetical protein